VIVLKENRLRIIAAMLVLLVGALLSSCSVVGGLVGNEDFSSEVPADSSERANPGVPRDNTPQVLVSEQPGAAVASSDRAALDFSNAASGYVCAISYLGDIKVKVLVDSPPTSQGQSTRYQYTITSGGSYVTIPLSAGSGTYTVGIYENISGDQYSPILSQDVSVELANEFGPFLYPNQVVEFTTDDATVQLSQQVTENATSDVEAVDQIYMYVVQNYSYDYDKADQVAAGYLAGYLPNNNDMLASQMGICFDFASLAASMMRAQRLPTKLDVGYCGQAYHAWIEVYTEEAGWVRKKIQFSGDAWVRMDPTFDSAGQGTGDISKIVGDGKNYNAMLYY
jgi:hypothetical protein